MLRDELMVHCPRLNFLSEPDVMRIIATLPLSDAPQDIVQPHLRRLFGGGVQGLWLVDSSEIAATDESQENLPDGLMIQGVYGLEGEVLEIARPIVGYPARLFDKRPELKKLPLADPSLLETQRSEVWLADVNQLIQEAVRKAIEKELSAARDHGRPTAHKGGDAPSSPSQAIVVARQVRWTQEVEQALLWSTDSASVGDTGRLFHKGTAQHASPLADIRTKVADLLHARTHTTTTTTTASLA
jgi:hypothetical protein